MRKLRYNIVLLMVFCQFMHCNYCGIDHKEKQNVLYILNLLNTVHIDPGASRTSGVAPLSVHFTAGFSNSTCFTRDFHDFDYTWDFGDPGSGSWGTTGKSRNRAKGPVTAHIFETPGTYTVNLTVRDGTAVVDAGSYTVEVLNPDAVYSGTNTTCVTDPAHAGDFAGCPAGAAHIETDSLAEVMTDIEAGTRILFRRGSSWTTDGLSVPGNGGPVTIGAYGAGTGQDALGNYANAPIITVTGGEFCSLDNKQDWRITDLHLVNSDRTAGSFGGAINMQRILFQRLQIDGFGTALGWSHWNSNDLMAIDQMVISDCDLRNSESIVLYIGGERIALLGSVIENSMDTHVTRVWQAYLGVISNNIMAGSSLNSDSGRHALKLHGPGYSTFAHVNEYGTPKPGTGLLEHRTEFAVVSDNIFGSSGPWPVAIGPQDTATNSLLSDIIFERNRTVTNYGTKSASSMNVNVALHVAARYVTVRNNIFDGTGSSDDYSAIDIWSEGYQPAPLGVEVYNNTIYRSDNSSGWTRIGISVWQTARKTIIKNNLISFPNTASGILKIAIDNSSFDLIEGGNLLADTPGFMDPDNIDPLSTDFMLHPGSPAIDAGVVVPVFEDMNNNARPDGIYDMGAYEN